MMNLAVDIGNTSVKLGWFDGNQLIEKQQQVSFPDLKQLINAKKPANVIASSTSSKFLNASEWEETNLIVVSPDLRLPFQLQYATPETIGSDRLAGVAGALQLFQNQNILIIDLGTCITYDFISADKIYVGGAISPGVQMRYKSMNTFTARLPLLDVPEVKPQIIGNSTKSCIDSGVINGMGFEIQGMITAYHEKFGKIKIILTGGDAHLFEKEYKEGIFAAPDLILIGLNVILQYNVANF